MHLLGRGEDSCDTIQGRQAMAAVFYHDRQYDDVVKYLASIKAYFGDEQDFSWNLGMALAASGRYEEGLEMLEKIKEFKYR